MLNRFYAGLIIKVALSQIFGRRPRLFNGVALQTIQMKIRRPLELCQCTDSGIFNFNARQFLIIHKYTDKKYLSWSDPMLHNAAQCCNAAMLLRPMWKRKPNRDLLFYLLNLDNYIYYGGALPTNFQIFITLFELQFANRLNSLC